MASDSDSSSGSDVEETVVSSPYPLFTLVITAKKASMFEVPFGWLLNVTGATLGADAKKGQRVLVAARTQDSVTGVICSLRDGAQEHVPLRLKLMPSPDVPVVSFQADSDCTVHLSGFLEPVNMGVDGDGDDGDDDDDDDGDGENGVDMRHVAGVGGSDSDSGDDSEEMMRLEDINAEDVDVDELLRAIAEDPAAMAKAKKDPEMANLLKMIEENGFDNISSDEGDSGIDEDSSSGSEEEAPAAVPIKGGNAKKRAADKQGGEEQPAAKKSRKQQRAEARAAAQAEAEAEAKAEAEAEAEAKAKAKAEAKKARKEKQKEKKKQQKEAEAKKAPKVVKLQGGLEYQDVRVGDGPVVKTGKRLRMRYNGTLLNGKKFDGNMPRGQPFVFKLGAGEVIKGWDMGIKGMRVGGFRKIKVPPQLGYGKQRSGPIPPNSTLLFDVEVIGM